MNTYRTGALASFAGPILTPGDEGYDAARELFNAMIDRHPAIIAQCESAADVTAALAFARAEGLDVAVRGGGHSVAGASSNDGGIVIDLRRMNAVMVDPLARTATVQGGATWADLDRACQPYGLATTGGRVSTTGVAGLTLGGGSGWYERKFGLACDNLVAVELVTADGRTVTANAEENPELFWALHGGGGNFGVATRLVLALEPLPQNTFGLLLWRAEYGWELLRRFRDLIERGASADLGGAVAYLTAPPEEFVPLEMHGERAVALIVVFAGPEERLREMIAPVLHGHEPAGVLLAEMPYADMLCAIDDQPGFRNYWSAQHLSKLTDEAIDLFVAQGESMLVPSPSQHLILPWGAAVADKAGDWPLPHRDASWVVHPFGLWEDTADDDYAVAWARNAVADLRPFSTGAVYLNFIGDEGQDRVVAGYGRANYDRLARVKAEFDPDNVFRGNHNIVPAALVRD